MQTCIALHKCLSRRGEKLATVPFANTACIDVTCTTSRNSSCISHNTAWIHAGCCGKVCDVLTKTLVACELTLQSYGKECHKHTVKVAHAASGRRGNGAACMQGEIDNMKLAWFDKLPCLRELPWVAVATAPPIVWSMNQLKAGSV